MIGKLRGVVDGRGDGTVILDVGGVGYLLHCSARTLAALPGTGEPATLAVETHVREDMIRLFGFSTAEDRAWFALLQSVQGVGSKVALAIQSTLSSAEIAGAVLTDDRTAVARAPGVGPRLALRIVSELKGKVSETLAFGASVMAPSPPEHAEAVSALVNLGYQKAAATAAVGRASEGAGTAPTTQSLIRLALRALSEAA